jgi:hypothetical protein
VINKGGDILFFEGREGGGRRRRREGLSIITY